MVTYALLAVLVHDLRASLGTHGRTSRYRLRKPRRHRLPMQRLNAPWTSLQNRDIGFECDVARGIPHYGVARGKRQ
jgi:hypothetical protein